MTTYIISYLNDTGKMGETNDRMEYQSSLDKEAAKQVWIEQHPKFTFIAIIYKV